MAHLYILRCSDGSYYVGSTRDLETRMRQHSSGNGGAYTRSRLPLELVYAQEFEERREAYAAERQVHGWRRAKREALIAGDFDLLPVLARRPRRA